MFADAPLSQAEVAVLYDRLAPVYDLWARLTEGKAHERLLELARIEDGQQVLEVAVGTGLGFASVVAANPHGRNTGIDISRGMLARAQRRLRRLRLSNYELSLGTALNIQAPDGCFDVLLNCYMFDLLSESLWPEVLREFHRVLKPGAKLALASMTFGERRGSGIYARLFGTSPALAGGCRPVRLSGPLVKGGFVVETREYIQQLLFPSEVILASKRS